MSKKILSILLVISLIFNLILVLVVVFPKYSNDENVKAVKNSFHTAVYQLEDYKKDVDRKEDISFAISEIGSSIKLLKIIDFNSDSLRYLNEFYQKVTIDNSILTGNIDEVINIFKKLVTDYKDKESYKQLYDLVK